MQDEQLVLNLKKKRRFQRLDALKKLVKSETFEAEKNLKANMNFQCRTEFSGFNTNPSLSAYKLMKNGFPVHSVVDYASLSGAAELMKAEKILGGVFYVGTEVVCRGKNKENVRMLSLGIPHGEIKPFNFELFFYRKLHNDYTDEILKKINERMKKFGITVSAPPRTFFKTTSVEDVFICFANAIIEKFRTGEAITDFIVNELSVVLSEDDEKRLEDTANIFYKSDLAATLYNNYKMKLPERKAKSVSEFVSASDSHGAISSLLLNGDENKAVDFAIKNKIKSITFDIDKVSPDFDAALFYDKCIAAGIIPLARMVCDYPKKKLVCEFADEKTAEAYRETMFAVIGHEISSSLDIADGLFSDRSVENTPDLKDRLRLFSRIGLKGSNINDL